MEALVIIGIVLGSTMLYGFVGGLVGEAHVRYRVWARDAGQIGGGSKGMDGDARWVTIAFWPVYIVLACALVPMFFGGGMVSRILPDEKTRQARADRKQRRQERAEREHQRTLEVLHAETLRNESARKLVEEYPG